MNRKELVRKANLYYDGTVPRSEEGLPIGNGTMGTMLWTSPASLKMQVNRVDVFANGNQTNSFFDTHEDYGYACAFVDIDFAGYGGDVFDGSTKQELDVYDAVARMESNGVKIECFAAEGGVDAFICRVEDSRARPEGIEIRMKMLRNAIVRTRSHVAASSLHRIRGAGAVGAGAGAAGARGAEAGGVEAREAGAAVVGDGGAGTANAADAGSGANDIAVLKQEFYEDDYYCASAVAICVRGRDARIRVDNENGGAHPVLPVQHVRVHGHENETDIRMRLAPASGAFDIFISSAATFDKNEDVIVKAVGMLNKAAGTGYGELKSAHKNWWNDFWDTSYVSLWGNDDAEKISVHYAYFFYIMASCSRNAPFAPNFGGLLFSPRGDNRHWGTMQWWNNLSLTYNAILPSGRSELIRPYLDMYFNMYAASETAARQIWGAEGIYIGETTYVWGPETLPDEIAEEMRELMLLRKPWAERSAAFDRFASGKNPFEPRWNFLVGKSTDPVWERGKLLYQDTPYGPVAHVSHIFGSMANLAYHYWLYYEYTGDADFLREKAYPMLRGITEFFRTYPNLIKEDDGLCHVLYSNHGESFWGGKDTLDTMTGMRGIFPTAIYAAGILGVDEDKVLLWEDLLRQLAPLPTSEDTECDVEIPEDGSVVWVGARGHALVREHSNVRPNPCSCFDMCNLQTEEANPAIYAIGRNMIDRIKRTYDQDDRRKYASEMSGYPRIFAAMGEGGLLLDNIIRQINSEYAAEEHCFFEWNGSRPVYRNRLTAREGINAISAQRLGNAAAGLQLGLLQCSGGAPALPPVIRVFPAWKKDWNAEFELYARGGFIVSSKMEGGAVHYVRVKATRDETLTLVNPWPAGAKSTAGDAMNSTVGDTAVTYSGSKIKLAMKAGDTLLFEPAD
jgi:hypothetical protein